MGGQYRAKENGRKYVDKTSEMADYATFLMLNMPERWNDLLTNQVALTAQRIETCVQKANAVYIPDYKRERAGFIKGLKEKNELLYEALRLFDDLHCKFDRLMRHVDLTYSEKKRLKKIVEDLIEESKKSDEEVPEIRLISRMGDVEYKSAGGSKVYKLKLTSKQKDHFLKLMYESRELIAKRAEYDNYQIKSASKEE